MAKGGRGILLGLALGAATSLWAYGRYLVGRAEALDPEDVRDPEETVYVDGMGIHYRDKGQGPPLLLIHGLGGSLANFDRIVPLLAEHFRVIALDLLGFGLSDRPPHGQYSYSAQARLVAGFMDCLGLQRASLLGHSLGGAIALRFASLYPQRVERLVLVASAPPARLAPPWAAMPFLGPILETGTALILHSRPLRKWVLRRGFWDASLVTPEVMERYYFPARLRGSVGAIARLIGGMGHDPPVDISQVVQPSLLLWGEGDRWLPPVLGRHLASHLPNARIEIIPQARHLLLEERPEESARVILSFLVEGETKAPPAARRRRQTRAPLEN